MKVAEAVGRALHAAGIEQVFGVVGSGNFHLTNALVAAGARFVAARHEGGAATMADAYARVSGTVAAVSVHQGPGLTNAMTGIAEAAKSRTPGGARGRGHPADLQLLRRPGRAGRRGGRGAAADHLGRDRRRTGVHGGAAGSARAAYGAAQPPLEVQASDAPDGALAQAAPPPPRPAVEPDASEVAALTRLLEQSRRPVFVAGRGSRSPAARDALEALAERCGALPATSAVARGLFHDNPWSLDVSGGFACPWRPN